MAETQERESEESGGSLAVGLIQRVKKHPVVVVVTSLVGLLLYLFTLGDLYDRITGTVQDWRDPHGDEHARIAELALGTSPGFVEERWGEPRRVVDVCAELTCPESAEGSEVSLRTYASDEVEVRAVFVDSSLDWYAVTVKSTDVAPPMTWLDHDLGTLGETSYADALAVPGVEPTGVNMFLGPQASGYVEVVAAGGAADFTGLLLAYAPSGWHGEGSFDADSARPVMDLNDAPFDASVAEPFRAASRPNTFGEFADDGGVVAELTADPENHRILLFA